jgi:two-component system, NtrC family, sensor kinase
VNAATSPQLHTVVVGTGPMAHEVAAELEAAFEHVRVVRVDDPDAALAWLDAAGGDVVSRTAVPLLIVTSAVDSVDAAVATLDQAPVFGTARIVLVTDRPVHEDVTAAVDSDRLDAVVAVPWTAGKLGRHARSQIARWLREHRPDDPRTASLVTPDGRPLERPDSELLREMELDAEAVTAQMLASIERVLGPRPRLRLPPGVRITHQGADVDAVLMVLSGSVALHRRTRVGDLRLHHASTGPVVGLLSLAHQRQAYFTARTTTEVEVVHLSIEQLDRALREDQDMGAALAAVSIRALARRLRRAEQLQIEKIELNRTLEAERRRLREALTALEEARLELVAQARFATLGELAAGIAHELNNPVAALERAASYLAEDVDRVLASHPQADLARLALRSARDRPPRGTAEERRLRRQLEPITGDRDLARRLVAAGVSDETTARRLVAADEDLLALLEAAAGIGGAVRNLEVASRRITGLVASLRAYARPDGDPLDDVDVHVGLEDTLRLTAHRLRGIDIERHYAADLPRIRCHPAQLDQVWTNLLVNAADSLEGHGRIVVTTDRLDDEHARVRIVDDGPGIDPDVLPRVFEPRFTTKQGTVRFGLGLGLSIAQRIVDAHGGRLELTSEPGRTEACAVLPFAGPPDDEQVARLGEATDDREGQA